MEIIEIIITIVFVLAFYRLNVNLDKDIFEQYRKIERDLK
tara:strand:- start:114 stop:233 length:120 start_codon:yes stop_codon:yes gene_type:complete